jgi:tRNA-specific 2-thiouridylase
MSTHKTVFVGMSGGVDSSVAAHLLKEQGYNVVGVFMKCYNIDGCAEADAEDARRVAEHIGIPFYVWDFEQEYKDRVVQYMIEGYRAGITPNPDVMCNREIKFGLFLEKALASGADYVATGHYVRLKTVKAEAPKAKSQAFYKSQNVIYKLYEAVDSNKDQSYFLWTLGQKQLAHCLFPIGGIVKPEVREIARRAGLPTAEKKDSQGICFLGKFSLDDFLRQYIPEKRGNLMTTAGEKIGEHSGAEFYTIGQRHIDADFAFPKTGPTGGAGAARKPLYVAAKNAATNTVVLAEGSDDPALYRDAVTLAQTNFISEATLGMPLPVRARVRYRQPLSAATLLKLENGNYKLMFAKPQKFVAEGQSAVFYGADGEMLGGGVIL